jgi:hypothetical protein
MLVVFVPLSLRTRDILALANRALEPFRIALLPAYFRVDRVEQIVCR